VTRAQKIALENKTSKNREKSLKTEWHKKLHAKQKPPKIAKNCKIGGHKKLRAKRKLPKIAKNR
jgi:hypothetical protein